MEELKNDKRLNLLKTIFIFVSLFFILYATITMRGMYIDGSYEIIQQLNLFDNSNFLVNIFHPNTNILSLLHLPVIFSHYVFGVDNKFVLMMLFSCSQLLLPFLFLCWNYCLTKRTQRIDIFFWSLFVYSLILLTFSIFSISEIYLGSIIILVLWHYMAAEIDYTLKDIIPIFLLTFCLLGEYDFLILLGPVFLIASLMYAQRTDSLKNKITKLFIGISIFSVSVYTFSYIMHDINKFYYIKSFITEGYNYFPHMIHICIAMSLFALLFICFSFFRKNQISNITLSIIGFVLLIIFGIFVNNLNVTLVPMWEGHLRTIPCWALPLICLGMYIFDLLKKEINIEKFNNYFCIVLICGIIQTCWQLVNTYFWDLNVRYMQKELYSHNDVLYIPSQHEEISDFFNPELKRYIWWRNYAVMSILFSDTNEQKTLLLNYDEDTDNCNFSYRDKLFSDLDKETISMPPFGAELDIKNKFWDLTKVSEALNKYNRENNIKTNIK